MLQSPYAGLSPANYFSKEQIVLYMPVEISPMPICHLAIKLGKECYLDPQKRWNFDVMYPVRHPCAGIITVFWNPYTMPGTRFCPGCRTIPLVGFDTTGNRIGMGKGYYDRTFANVRTRWRKPTLTGLAHSFQQTQIDPMGHSTTQSCNRENPFHLPIVLHKLTNTHSGNSFVNKTS